MVQIGTPDGTVSNDWTVTGSGTAHEALASASDSSLIETATQDDACRVNISSLTDPVSSIDHTIKFRAKATGSGAPERVQVKIFEGTTERAASGNIAITRGSFNAYSYTLDSTETDAISDYTDLRIEIIAAALGSETLEVSEAFFEIPDAGGTEFVRGLSDTITVSDTLARKATYNRAPTPNANVTVSDLLAREKCFVRSDSDTIPVSDTVTRIKGFVKSIANTVTVSDLLARMMAYKRELGGVVYSQGNSDDITRGTAEPMRLGQRITFSKPTQISKITAKVSFATEPTTGTVIGRIWKDATGTSQTVVATSNETFNLADLDDLDVLTFTFPNYTAENVEYVIGIEHSGHDVSSGLRVSSGNPEAGTASYRFGTASWFNDGTARDIFGVFTQTGATVIISDTVTRIKGHVRAIVNTVIVSDVVAAIKSGVTFDKFLTETVIISDTVTRIQGHIRAIANTVTVSDTVARFIEYMRTLSETVTVSDDVARVFAVNRALSETVTVSDDVTRFIEYMRTLNETVTITDDVQRQVDYIRNLSDTIAISDTVTRIQGHIRSLSETESISDQVARVIEYNRTLTETVTVSDDVTRIQGHIRAIANTVIVSDTLARVVQYFRNLSDTIGISDVVAGVKSGVTFDKFLTETVTVSDTLSRFIEYMRAIANTVTVSDALSRAGSAYKREPGLDEIAYSEQTGTVIFTLGNSETNKVGQRIIFPVRTQIGRITIKISDPGASGGTIQGKIWKNASGTSETIVVSSNETLNLADISDGEVVTFTFPHYVAENVQYVIGIDALGIDSLPGIFQTSASLETGNKSSRGGTGGSWTDSSTRDVFMEMFTASGDSVQVSDSLSRIKGLVRTLAETTTINDTVARIHGHVRAFTETVIVSDTITRFIEYMRNLSDTITVSDTVARMVAYKRAIANTVSVSDLVVRLLTLNRSLAETVTVSDTVTRFVEYKRAIVNTVTISDTLAKMVAYKRAIVNTVIISDVVTVIKSSIIIAKIHKVTAFVNKTSLGANINKLQSFFAKIGGRSVSTRSDG